MAKKQPMSRKLKKALGNPKVAPSQKEINKISESWTGWQ